MLVDVIRLRDRGTPRARDDVMGSAPIRGALMFSHVRPGHANWKGRRFWAGLQDPCTGEWLLPVLDPAIVRKIDSRGMIVVGVEHMGIRQRDVREYPQAWWCRPLAVLATAPPSLSIGPAA